jgi:tetratricopeptide (TPR) repeat protein
VRRTLAAAVTLATLAAASSAATAPAAGSASLPAPAGTSTPTPTAPSNLGPAPSQTPSPSGQLFADVLHSYHAALAARRLGDPQLRREEIGARVAEGEDLIATGRVDEAIARLVAIVESPDFDRFADLEEGRAAVFRLGDALAVAGIYEPARAYLRRVVDAKGAWDAGVVGRAVSVWARRAVRRLVDVALESRQFAPVADDLKGVPANAPEDVRGEIAYMTGRAQEAAGNPDAALAAYLTVTQRSRFWAQATYLSALIDVDQGRFADGENLLCKVADPKRSATTTPLFADEKFFAVRDLARLGLGRIAHEQRRNDDARYYYYLVPSDSDRLAEALYESATTRYEKKDYDGARELLDELVGLGVRHRYEDEAWILDAWVDLARCRFADADKKLTEFLRRYEPVRDAARRMGESNASIDHLLAAVRSGTDAAGAEIGGTNPDVVRAVAALVRVDPSYDRVLAERATLEREASGLVYATAAIDDMQRTLATNGGVRPAEAGRAGTDGASQAREVRRALDGVEHQLTDLEAARAPEGQLTPLRQALAELQARADHSGGPAAPPAAGEATGGDLADLLRADSARSAEIRSRIDKTRADLGATEAALAKDALHRLDLRLSRLLRRARLGRIESVLGRKRALEVEVEAIRLGYLPQDAVDSLDASRYLGDGEEYWPFEGDDWPDEYVGSEIK